MHHLKYVHNYQTKYAFDIFCRMPPELEENAVILKEVDSVRVNRKQFVGGRIAFRYFLLNAAKF